MANILPFGQIQSFGMPAEFWVRRAERCREQNMPVRALALLRHAIQLEPDDPDLRLEYACVLRELCCFEASNRACFELLARRPSAFGAFSLVAENMLSLGNLSEAGGAYEIYANYIRMHPEEMTDWDDDLYEVEDALNFFPRGHKYVRLEGLFKAAGLRIRRGEWAKAKRLLDRSRQKPFPAKSAQRSALLALYYHGIGEAKKAERLALLAARTSPRLSGLLLSMAMLLCQLHSPYAKPMLMKAAAQAVTADDERGVCVLAAEMDLPWVAESMLRRVLKTAPNRMSAVCDLAIFKLREGDLAAAGRLARPVSEIEPDDPDGEALSTQIAALTQNGADAAAVRAAGKARPFYGAPDPARLADDLQVCCNLLVGGVEPLAEQLGKDGRLRRQFLELFTLDGNQSRLLPRLAECMPPKECAALFRRLLLLGGTSAQTVQAACDGLRTLGYKPPFLARLGGRLLLLDPNAAPPETPSFLQRMLFRRLREFAVYCGPAALTWALGVVRRLSDKDCLRMAGDRNRIWAFALQAAYAQAQGYPPFRLDDDILTPERLHAFLRARKAVARAAQGRLGTIGASPL